MWKQVVVYFTLGVVTKLQARDQVLYAAAPSDRGAFHVGSARGTYNYGYNTGDGIAKVEVRRNDGSVVGSYRYFDATGKQIVRSYIADEKGFRVLGNDLPISPNTQVTAIEGLPAFTAPVEGDTSSKYHKLGFSSNQQSPQSQNTISHQRLASRPEQEALRKQAAILKQQEELILKQQQQLDELKRQYGQYQLQFQQNEPKPTQTVSQPLYSQSIPNVLSPYLLLPNKVNYDFPAGFALKGIRVLKRPIGVKGEHEFMADYAAGHSPSKGHLHDPVGPHKEIREYYNPLTAGHTRTIPTRRRYIIGHAK